MPAAISEIPQVNAVANSDLLIVEINPNSTPNTKTIEVSNLFKTIFSNSISTNNIELRVANTPANSTISISEGSFFFDTDYVYFAVANNVLKRVSLSAF